MLRSTLFLIAATSVSALELGCFTDRSETLSNFVNNGFYVFQSMGYCQQACDSMGHSYYALKGTDCWCGDAIPPISDMVDHSNCDISCAGYVKQNCGGAHAFEVYVSGSDATIHSIISAYSGAATVPATFVASDSITILATATTASSESPSPSASDSLVPTTAAVTSAAATTTTASSSYSSSSFPSSSSSTVVVPSPTSSRTSVPTGAAAAVNVQIGFGLMAGLMALMFAL
ncbi:hypothetical protein TMatcc_009607 [Talaromyces marneffei ATCC 18224]|uniref:WSC domain-containing protein n=2 Tax=Talaromyces marneffei TaxID=37727 RepID=B6QST6_TALMQ|nr:uncharacterized protein EYB26_008850 [Talaromyces marneffei]EEA19471.1 conserved hypothetical protein [Talaromyces marneffei ATCC 18224]KAE8547789.1 hypothetical protein EYB25_009582 [Talaromyces marneffei]QGA21140.1 hypothetical protein EYB26_008850 [Talaromyces marneffei]